MTTAPTFLVRCPDCLGLHPWRQAQRSALPIERVEPHTCPHGQPCGVRICEHGRPLGDVRAEPNGDGPTVLACVCIGSRGCQECAESRTRFIAERDRKARENPREAMTMRLRTVGTCVVCREVERQMSGSRVPSGGWCVTLKRRSGKHGETEVEPNPRGCVFRAGMSPPPWCAGATEAERKAFLEALPEPMRAGALEEARKANRQEGATQKRETPKVERKKTADDKQRTLF